ncbi:MAG: carbon monoxide dehydrogenase subunit G [Verrucomicrobiales bacterium]|jgi:carbon monoxide dehydrogenase subunit G
MTQFSARTISASTVPVPSDQIWEILTDPDSLAELTPLIRSIEASGSRWLWTLNGIEALGMRVEAAFTESMEFTDERQIVFTHDPPQGKKEHAAVEGIYDLTPAGPNSTDLRVDLTLSVELPLPRMARPAVERVILATMRATGRQFASNLYQRLELDPKTAEINELSLP